MIFDERGTSARSRRLSEEEQEALGITAEDMQEAFAEAGGSLNCSGHYPINQKLKNRLHAGLDIPENRMQEAF